MSEIIVAPPPREFSEIQRAHDVIAGVVLQWERFKDWFPVGTGAPLVNALNTLCWVLQHDHNPAFEETLKQVEDTMAKRGFVLEEMPRFFTGEE
jgi:hypothetical protein